MAYTILGINPGHNGSIAVVEDGNLVHYCEEERVSRIKYDGDPFLSIENAVFNYRIDAVIVGGTSKSPQMSWGYESIYSGFVRKFYPHIESLSIEHNHHLGHAANAFYNSGFNNAIALVIDGAGSNNERLNGYEHLSIYRCSYPNNFELIHKKLYSFSDDENFSYSDDVYVCDKSKPIVSVYEAVNTYLGFSNLDGGKTMGLSSYGNPDDDVPDLYQSEDLIQMIKNPKDYSSLLYYAEKYPKFKRNYIPLDWHYDSSKISEIEKNIAYKIQKQSEERVISIIKDIVKDKSVKNIVISGGYGLNCVANYKYANIFSDINFYIDPISHDGGTAIGIAKFVWFEKTKSKVIKPLKSLYLGLNPDYDAINNYSEIVCEDVDVDTVANLLSEGKVIALFQGKSEAGPRALGNRSILFDARVKDGKNIINNIKKREWFRPFAGTVLHEHANEWFNMINIKESPFMMYAVDVLPEKKDTIPGIVHVDNTCRVQTLKKENNKNFYELLNAFHHKTGVPILMNTSFNLAGQPLVELVADAIETLLMSEIDFLYMPEIRKIIRKK